MSLEDRLIGVAEDYMWTAADSKKLAELGGGRGLQPEEMEWVEAEDSRDTGE